MANTTSAKKATRKIERRTAVNRVRRSRMRTFVKKVEEALRAGDKTAAAEAFKSAQPELMRAAHLAPGFAAKNCPFLNRTVEFSTLYSLFSKNHAQIRLAIVGTFPA